MKLSPPQIELLTLLANGWEACWAGGLGGGASVQKGGIGYGGELRISSKKTLGALIDRKLVERTKGDMTIGETYYRITNLGRRVLKGNR